MSVWPLPRGQVFVVRGALAEIIGNPEWSKLDRADRLGLIVELLATNPDGTVDEARVLAAAEHPRIVALAEKMLAGVEPQGGPGQWPPTRGR